MKLNPVTNPRRVGWVRWRLFLLGLLAGGLMLAPGLLSAQPTASKEYQVKAAFLFNFTQFIEWPTNAFPEPKAPFIIGILGNDPFGKTLDEIVRGESLNGHALVIQRFRRVEEIEACHMIFVSLSERKQVPEILARLQGRALLTVSDVEGFAQQGGMIRFVTENNKIRFRVNMEATKAANLTISSKLLKAADIVARSKD